MPFPPTRIVFQNNECSSLLSSDLNVVKESANQVPINSCSKAKKVEVYIPSERPRRRRDAALFPTYRNGISEQQKFKFTFK